jgi:hypothetical protein
MVNITRRLYGIYSQNRTNLLTLLKTKLVGFVKSSIMRVTSHNPTNQRKKEAFVLQIKIENYLRIKRGLLVAYIVGDRLG